jgi:hypothetical protein
MATKPEYFFNKANSKVLDQAWADISIKALGICSGITSVAIFYLEQRGIKVPCPELGS